MKNWIWCFSVLLICFNKSTAIAEVLTNKANKELTVSIGNQQSWTGRNGTGNLSYYGCDRAIGGDKANGDECIYLTGGKITCRDGVCRTIWQNKNYSYVLSSPITEATLGSQITSTLTIYSDSKIVLEEELYPKPFDNIEFQN